MGIFQCHVRFQGFSFGSSDFGHTELETFWPQWALAATTRLKDNYLIRRSGGRFGLFSSAVYNDLDDFLFRNCVFYSEILFFI